MRAVYVVLLLSLVCATSLIRAQTGLSFLKATDALAFEIAEINVELPISVIQAKNDLPKHERLKASLLSVFLGHFGVHRIYLGTKANVPVVYSLTLGGGLGILPLADFIAILTAKDLAPYRNSDKVFMWLNN